jgi:hypothetical protein|tara:strand:- start:1820 stop:2323 length:504 start_codon:yes stop_codon:yes gene_type:complete
MVEHYIYKTSVKDGRYYIGRHSTKYNDSYQGSGNWIKDCQKNNIKLDTEILEYCSSTDELITKEHEYLKEHISNTMNMNEKTDSSGWTSETAAFFGEKNGMYGKKHTPESIRLMKENRKGKNVGHTRNVGENNPMFGKKRVHSAETKRKISESRKRFLKEKQNGLLS